VTADRDSRPAITVCRDEAGEMVASAVPAEVMETLIRMGRKTGVPTRLLPRWQYPTIAAFEQANGW
jgi:hypothetical protein